MQERRITERYSLILPAKIKVLDSESESEVIESKTKDISSSGAFIMTDTPLPEGTSIDMEFNFSIAKLVEMMGKSGYVRLKVEGKVARLDEEGMAVRFSKDYEIKALEP